jgi:ABC-type dipeptide/oligopeptide/nickel transport system ATPase subunit
VTYEASGVGKTTIYRAMVVLCDEKCGFGIGYNWPEKPNLEPPNRS